MSDVIAKGVEVVRNAEASLRELMQSAVNEGQYGRVTVLARCAEQLAQIGINGSQAPTQKGGNANGMIANSTSRRPRRKGRARTKRIKSKYPIFRRAGDSLVKIAWSKASKSEYQHQAPKDVVILLMRKMQEFSHGEELLTMDAVLPLMTEDGGEVPAYQTYACLAWLRETGAVTQHGRKGYSVDGRSTAESLIEQRWSELPAHRL